MAMPRKGLRTTRKLRQWTVEQVESGKFPGLVWDDPPAKTMFRIPWKHAGKQEFRHEEDAGFFKAWAMFKGKYQPGERLDPAAWKTRIRCALSKSPEFKEMPERSRLDILEPYKVYRLVPLSEQHVENQSKRQRRRKAKLDQLLEKHSCSHIPQPPGSLSVLKREESSGSEAPASHTPKAFDPSAYQNGESSPQPGETGNQSKQQRRLKVKLEQLSEKHMCSHNSRIPQPPGSLSVLKRKESSGSEASASHTQNAFDPSGYQNGESSPQPGETAPDVNEICLQSNPEAIPDAAVGTGDFSVLVSIFYSGELMLKIWLPEGEFLITSTPALPGAPTNSLTRVLLPSPDKMEDPQKKETIQRLLKDLDRGAMAASNQEGIFIQCRSKASVSWWGAEVSQPHGKLEPNTYLQLFSTRKFKTALEQCQQGLPHPEHLVSLCVGQDAGKDDRMDSKPITIQMEQIFALRLINSHPSTPAVEAASCSDPVFVALWSADILASDLES